MNAAFDFTSTPRRLECPVTHPNPSRYMFAQHVTSLGGPVTPIPSGEAKASSLFYKRELPGPARNPQTQLMVPNMDDGLQFYFPDNTGYDGAINEQAQMANSSTSPWMDMHATKLLHGQPTLPKARAVKSGVKREGDSRGAGETKVKSECP